MLGLLKRDFLLMVSSKQMLIFLLFYIPFFILISESFIPEIFYFMIIVFYTYMMSIMSFSFDVTGKSKYIMNSLPISRGELILYKYLSTFVYFAASIVYAGVYLWIIDSLKLVSVDYFNLKQIANALPTVMIFISILYPVYFRFEPKIAQIIQMVVLMVFFTIIGNISFTGDKGILKYISLLQWKQFMVIAIVMYILSFILSNQLYKKRDI